MQATTYPISIARQPTPTSCSQTALSMLLGHYDKSYTVDELSGQVPQVYSDNGESFGTINQQMATWCLSLGFDCAMHTADCQIIDQSWAGLSKDELIDKLKARADGWVVPALGDVWTKAYADSYIDYLHAGGQLTIQPAITTQLLYSLLETGPVLALVCSTALNGSMRRRFEGETEIHDDIHGRALNHSIVIYGHDQSGNFLVADPDQTDGGDRVIAPERMVIAIATAQIECDTLLFQLSERGAQE